MQRDSGWERTTPEVNNLMVGSSLAVPSPHCVGSWAARPNIRGGHGRSSLLLPTPGHASPAGPCASHASTLPYISPIYLFVQMPPSIKKNTRFTWSSKVAPNPRSSLIPFLFYLIFLFPCPPFSLFLHCSPKLTPISIACAFHGCSSPPSSSLPFPSSEKPVGFFSISCQDSSFLSCMKLTDRLLQRNCCWR